MARSNGGDESVNQGAQKSPAQRDLNAALRMKQVAELRLKGLEFAEIARQCGYKDASGAWRAWKKYLAKLPVVDTAGARSDAERRLNVALAAIWDKVSAGNMWAIDRLLAIEKRRAELMGLDTPKADEQSINTVVIREVPQGLLPLEAQNGSRSA